MANGQSPAQASTNHNFQYLSIFALAKHSQVHFFQKGDILAESERDTLHDPLGKLLTRLRESSESEPATKSSLNTQRWLSNA